MRDLFRKMREKSVLQRLHGSRQAAAAVDEHRGVVAVHRHDGTIAQQTAEVQHLAGLAADGGDDAHGGGLAVQQPRRPSACSDAVAEKLNE